MWLDNHRDGSMWDVSDRECLDNAMLWSGYRLGLREPVLAAWDALSECQRNYAISVLLITDPGPLMKIVNPWIDLFDAIRYGTLPVDANGY